MGIQAEKETTTFAFGSRDRVLAFFAHENKSMDSMNNSGNEEFTFFSIPMDGEMLKKLESSKLSDPHGPLGPLATTLGEAMYKITKISGRSKLAGDRAHFDFVIECSDPQSAQSIWSVGQASLGMAQLSALRNQMKNPEIKPMISMDFLNKIKLKQEGNRSACSCRGVTCRAFSLGLASQITLNDQPWLLRQCCAYDFIFSLTPVIPFLRFGERC